ncbi:MAG: NUDIX domain-containing protein [Actinoallomurus sp.]
MSNDDLPKFTLAFPGPLRDRLVTAVLAGDKIATTGLLVEYERAAEPLPAAGERAVMVDSSDRPVAIVETTGVRVLPLGEVDLAYVRDEGEGHTSVSAWRADHERFWHGEGMRASLGDPDFTVDDRTRVVAQWFRVVERLTALAADELLDIVDENDEVIGQLSRGEATERGLRHRCVFVFVRDGEGRIFVHRRTPVKLVWPSLYDMFVGGVVGAGESYDEAALREAEEELGVSGLPRPVPLFSFLFEDPGHTWWSRVYEVRCDLPVSPQAEEVAWHAFLTEEELEEHLPEWEWVPDGLEAYHRLRGLGEA